MQPKSIKDAIAEFIRSREAMGCTPSTLQHYHTELYASLAAFLARRGITTIEAITASDLTEYLGAARDRGCSGNSIQSYRIRVSAFMNWGALNGYAEEGLMKRVPKPRSRQYIRRTHTDEEVKKMLETATDARLYHPFDSQELYALVILLLDTGLRAAEICRLDVGDVDDDVIRVRGKGDKERYVAVSPTTRGALQEFLKMRYGARDGEPLFINRGYGKNYANRGLRITVSGLYQRIKRLGLAAGVASSPHKWRHTFALWSMRNGANVKALQMFLGHASLETTDNYLRGFGFQDAAREHRAFSPVSGMMKH